MNQQQPGLPVFFQVAIQDGHLHVAPLGTPYYDTASPAWVDVGPAPDWGTPLGRAPEMPPLIRDLLAELPSGRAFPAAARSPWLGAMRAAMILLWPSSDDESADLDWWEARANILASALRTAAAAEPAGSPAAQVYQAMLAGMTERYGDPGPLFPAGDHAGDVK